MIAGSRRANERVRYYVGRPQVASPQFPNRLRSVVETRTSVADLPQAAKVLLDTSKFPHQARLCRLRFDGNFHPRWATKGDGVSLSLPAQLRTRRVLRPGFGPASDLGSVRQRVLPRLLGLERDVCA